MEKKENKTEQDDFVKIEKREETEETKAAKPKEAEESILCRDFLERLPSSDKENFVRLCNKLLNVGFLCKKKAGSKKDYYFIQKHRKLFEQYLSVLGYELELHEEYGVVHLLNRFQYNHYRLKLYDSIILIILRILYDEKKRELSLADDIIVTVGEIQEKYLALKIRNGLIDKTTMNNALMLFKRFQLLDTLDKDLTLEDTRILLLDSLLFAVKVEDIKTAFEKLQRYKRGMEEE